MWSLMVVEYCGRHSSVEIRLRWQRTIGNSSLYHLTALSEAFEKKAEKQHMRVSQESLLVNTLSKDGIILLFHFCQHRLDTHC
jgi:hypothetical protein